MLTAHAVHAGGGPPCPNEVLSWIQDKCDECPVAVEEFNADDCACAYQIEGAKIVSVSS